LRIDAAVYKTLLESTRAIPWRIDWPTHRFSYIGPQIEPLLGWARDSWSTVDDWASRIHQEDRQRVVDFCVSQSRQGVDHEADYRALKADGGWVWIRDVVHVVREREEVVALVGFMFDISERRERELEVLRLHRELEELSYRDGLTDVANRRMFERTLAVAWERATSVGGALAILLVDIDFFKDYNDCYGHLAGDECLRRVASILVAACTPSGGLVARFGGEEFGVVLPDVDGTTAAIIAERCRRFVSDARIPHAGAKASGYLTVSVGVGAVRPASGTSAREFLDSVDRRLYLAKRNGRDRVE